MISIKRLPAAALGASLVLAACGGGGSASSASPAPTIATTTSASAATGSTAAGASASVGGSAAAKPAAATGPTAPGPYTAKGSTTETGGAATVQATDSLQWNPNTIMAKAGDKVTLTIQNTGNTAHTFISPGLGVPTQQDVPIQKSSTVTFTVPSAPGAYQFWCNIPGHAEAGMVGEVIVQ
ncbi:MAG: cupredoxin domain-containing protein [Chloroflexi bacterium]|nr:cupredoxin domain-containing protein [Chloroflexota bacterium]